MSPNPERRPFAVPEVDWKVARAFVRERVKQQWPSAEEAEIERRAEEGLVRLSRLVRREIPVDWEGAMTAVAARAVVEHLRGARRWRSLLSLRTAGGTTRHAGSTPWGDPLERFRFLALNSPALAAPSIVERIRVAAANHPRPPAAAMPADPEAWGRAVRRFARTIAREPEFAPLSSWTLRASGPGVPADEIAAHAWFAARVLPFLTGLLRESEDALFREFGDRDGHCRLAYAPFAEGAGEPAETEGHVPSAALVRWAHAPRELGASESRLVREHVAGCEECRGDLAVLDLEVDLPRGAPPPRAPRFWTRRRRRAALFLWAVLATAAALLLSGLALRSASPLPRIGGAVEAIGMPHLVLAGARRSPPVLPSVALTRDEPLFVRVPEIPPAVHYVVVELCDAAGHPLARERLPVARVNEAFQLALRPSSSWRMGTHRLRVYAGDGETPLFDWSFEVRVAEK